MLSETLKFEIWENRKEIQQTKNHKQNKQTWNEPLFRQTNVFKMRQEWGGVKVGWVKNKLKTLECSTVLNCVVLEAETILRGSEFHIGTMRDAKKTVECHFQLLAL